MSNMNDKKLNVNSTMVDNRRLIKYKELLINKSVKWLTCIDVIYNDNQYTAICQCRCGNIKQVQACRFAKSTCPKSCGCYKTSAEFSNSQRQYLLDNPELIEYGKQQTKKWNTEHPEEAKLRNKRVSDWAKNNPEKIAKKETKHKQWFKDNPGKVHDQTVAGKARYLKERQSALSKVNLKSFIHPDDIELLFTTNNNSHVSVRTKCPRCGNYSYHSFHNVYNYTTGKYIERLCNKCCCDGTSYFEVNIHKFVSTFYKGECIRNSRSIISPLELDLFYPEKNIAIEFNGDYWHDENHKSKNYHLNKYLKCKEKGILLVSIFETEWNSNKDSIKSYIKDVFNHISNRLSYIKENCMSNNYPDINSYSTLSNNMLEDYYTFGSNKVFTCGYTRLE